MKLKMNCFLKNDEEGISLLDVTIKGDMEIPLRVEAFGVDSSYAFDDEYIVWLLAINKIKVYSDEEDFNIGCKGLVIDTIDTHYYDSNYENYAIVSVIGRVIGIEYMQDEVYASISKEEDIWSFDIVPREFVGVNNGIMTIESMGVIFKIPFSKQKISQPINLGSIINGEFNAILFPENSKTKEVEIA